VNEHERNHSDQTGDTVPAPRPDRKPYSKPAFRSEQVFETMALQCGKIQGTGGSCNLVKQAS
jgi:hypothetical protein